MKRILFLVISIFTFQISHSSDWVRITSDHPQEIRINLAEASPSASRLIFELDGFYKSEVQTGKGIAWKIASPKGAPSIVEGAPDLPAYAVSFVIPDRAGMEVRISSADYVTYENVLVAPSKGNLTRDTNPSDVEYTFGRYYGIDGDYPGQTGYLADPYIVRDFRGQALQIHPFQYNPVTRTLKVYYHIEFEVVENGVSDYNALNRNSQPQRIDSRFAAIYERHFINFAGGMRYEPVEEEGSMLIISHGDFLEEVEPFAAWKRMSGIPCTVVDVEDIGAADDIKQFIQDTYDEGNLTFVLLVGDADKVPTSQSMGNDSDNDYTYVAGDDHYPDLFIGRFSAETEAHVNTMVERTLTYEANPVSDTAWYSNAIGIGSQEGPGDDGELDFEHLRNISDTKLIPFTYDYAYEFFEGSQGGNDGDGYPTAQEVGVAVDSGATISNYTGHGSTTSWGTSGFSNWDIADLSNTGRWPFIISVACVNGNFVNETCFAEAWTRAEHEGVPTGAVATLMSTINQSWNPPMRGQDEMNSILTEAYEDNIKRTFGGITMNGCMNMNDVYGQGGFTETDCWTIFGDPSLMVRTAPPMVMEVTHAPAITLGESNFMVSCDAEGALAVLSFEGEILGTAYVSSGQAVIEFDPVGTLGEADIVITGFNYRPYLATVDLIAAEGPFLVISSVTVNDEQGNGNGMLDYAEDGVYLTIGLTNIGADSAFSVEALLGGDLEFLEIDGAAVFYGDIPPDDTVFVTDAFTFNVADSVPDLFDLSFFLSSADEAGGQWDSYFELTAHAPVLAVSGYLVNDEGGNGNNDLDPGETADMILTLVNAGSSDAFGLMCQLSSYSDYLTILSDEQFSGDLEAGAAAEVSFTLAAAGDTPDGYTADLMLEMAAEHNITGSDELSVLIGKKPLLVVDFSNAKRTSDSLAACLDMLQVNATISDQIPADYMDYKAMFVLLGVYPENHILTIPEGELLAAFLDAGGKIYMEGGDTWFFDDPTPVHEYFRIQGDSDGGGDLTDIFGVEGGFLSWFAFTYDGTNNYIDQISPGDNAELLLVNQQPYYGVSVSYDGGTYKTVGSSFDFAGLVDGPESSKDEMIAEILDFFGIGYTWTGVLPAEERITDISLYPNPASQVVTIEFYLEDECFVTVEAYDLTGRRVAGIAGETFGQGSRKLSWNISGSPGSDLRHGIYFVRIRAGSFTCTRKLILTN